MRDERLVLAIAAVLNKRLQTTLVCVIQGPKYTLWSLDGKGFAVGPCPDVYPPKQLLEAIQKYLTPPMPVRNKRDDNN